MIYSLKILLCPLQRIFWSCSTRKLTKIKVKSTENLLSLYDQTLDISQAYLYTIMNQLLSIGKELVWTFCSVVASFILAVIRVVIPPARKSVKNETVLITGTGSGIGRVMAQDFAKLGAKVIMWDINEKCNKQTERLIREQGAKAYAYTVDVSNRQAIFDAADLLIKNHGDVDILINNAGIVSGKTFLEISDDMVQKTMEVNVFAHFWTVKSFLPAMKKRNHGHIVTIASIAGLVGCNNLVDYCASKFANVGFNESLSLELFEENLDGIHTTVVCPYYIDTGMFAGCKTRFPWMLQHLKPREAVDRIMQAILTNQKIVLIPRQNYIIALLKSIMPVDCSILLHKFFGASSFMDTFIGHNAEQQRVNH